MAGYYSISKQSKQHCMTKKTRVDIIKSYHGDHLLYGVLFVVILCIEIFLRQIRIFIYKVKVGYESFI